MDMSPDKQNLDQVFAGTTYYTDFYKIATPRLSIQLGTQRLDYKYLYFLYPDLYPVEFQHKKKAYEIFISH
jgi:hypothetical protein